MISETDSYFWKSWQDGFRNCDIRLIFRNGTIAIETMAHSAILLKRTYFATRLVEYDLREKETKTLVVDTTHPCMQYDLTKDDVNRIIAYLYCGISTFDGIGEINNIAALLLISLTLELKDLAIKCSAWCTRKPLDPSLLNFLWPIVYPYAKLKDCARDTQHCYDRQGVIVWANVYQLEWQAAAHVLCRNLYDAILTFMDENFILLWENRDWANIYAINLQLLCKFLRTMSKAAYNPILAIGRQAVPVRIETPAMAYYTNTDIVIETFVVEYLAAENCALASALSEDVYQCIADNLFLCVGYEVWPAHLCRLHFSMYDRLSSQLASVLASRRDYLVSRNTMHVTQLQHRPRYSFLIHTSKIGMKEFSNADRGQVVFTPFGQASLSTSLDLFHVSIHLWYEPRKIVAYRPARANMSRKQRKVSIQFSTSKTQSTWKLHFALHMSFTKPEEQTIGICIKF